MRLVAWNCRDSLARKVDALMSLRPDVAIISEVRRGALQLLPDATSCIWAGPEGQKGLGIFGFGDWWVRELGDLYGNWFMPFEAQTDQLRLCGAGVWTETRRGSSYQSIAEAAVSQMLQHWAPMVVAGDFNLSEKLKDCRISGVSSMFAVKGLQSVWHARNSQIFGAERSQTYFQHRRAELGFHIDYVFLDQRCLAAVDALQLGGFDDWVGNGLSDHCPIVVEISDAALAATSLARNAQSS